jgi:hypothetical protein
MSKSKKTEATQEATKSALHKSMKRPLHRSLKKESKSEGGWGRQERDQLVLELKQAWKKSTMSRSRDAQFPYCELVLAKYKLLAKEAPWLKAMKSVTAEIAKDAAIERCKKMSPIARLIAASCPEKIRVRSRLAAAIALAAYEGWERLTPKFRRLGGIAGCARRWAKIKRGSRPPRRRRHRPG